MNYLQKSHISSTDDKPFYIGSSRPEGEVPDSNFKTTIGEFKASLFKNKKILVKNCIILLVSFWEVYCKDKGIPRYKSDEIREVILYRNCILHDKDKINERYVKDSKLKLYSKGDILNLDVEDFERFLSYFEKE